jgi:hypothetical protein
MPWTDEEIGKLRKLRAIGATLSRASVALKRGRAAVQDKARELGIPFPPLRERRREQQAKEAVARAKAGLK